MNHISITTVAELERAFPHLCAQLRAQAAHTARKELLLQADAPAPSTPEHEGEELMKRALQRRNQERQRRNAA